MFRIKQRDLLIKTVEDYAKKSTPMLILQNR